MTIRYLGRLCGGIMLSSALSLAAHGASATQETAGPAIRIQQVRPAYAGPAALVDALNAGNAPALALAGADFDADGASDLVVGYSWHGAGIVSLQRGNPDALAP